MKHDAKQKGRRSGTSRNIREVSRERAMGPSPGSPAVQANEQ